MSFTKVKQQLKTQDKDQLIKLLAELYNSVPSAKEYLDVYASGDINSLIEKYQDEIDKYMYPKGVRMTTNEKEARKLIRTLQKMKIPELTIELKLHYVDCGITMIEDFGYMGESYDTALENQFYQAFDVMEKEGMVSRYHDIIDQLTERGRPYGLLEEW